jgi:tetratricopeptide (TPR) repeat protein
MPRIALVLFALASQVLAQETAPPTAADLLRRGDAEYLKGRYEAAATVFTEANASISALPANDPLHYDLFKRMANVRAAAGEYSDAESWLQQAITWRENTFGQRDLKIPDDLLLDVSLCRRMKMVDRAIAIMQRVITLHSAAYTAESQFVADDFSGLATLHAELKNHNDALKAVRVALDIRTRMAGPMAPSLMADLERQGEYQNELRDYEGAEKTYRQSLIIRETVFGRVHADLIKTLDGLAYSLFGQKKYADAEPVYARLLGVWETSVGPEHPMVAVALDKVASFYSAQGKNEEVRAAMDRSTAIRARFLAMGYSEQAVQAFAEKRLEDSKALYRRALGILDQPGEVNSELRVQIQANLKQLEALVKKPAAAAAKKAAPGGSARK